MSRAESYDRCLAVNTRGTFFLTQAFARRLLARPAPAGHRSIVTISSANAIAVSIARGEYCVSKAAVSMMSKLFAARLANDGIGVYEIQPGFIETDMTAPSKARYDKLIDEGLTVIKRFGRPEEVGRIAATLAKGLLPYTTRPDHPGRCRPSHGEILNMKIQLPTAKGGLETYRLTGEPLAARRAAHALQPHRLRRRPCRGQSLERRRSLGHARSSTGSATLAYPPLSARPGLRHRRGDGHLAARHGARLAAAPWN